MNKKTIIILSIIVALSAFFVTQLEFKPEYSTISVFFMVLLCVPTYYYFIKKTNTKRAILTIFLLSIFSMIIESIGVITGFPYGSFDYGTRLGTKIGVIPWTVSFGWVPLIIASWSITKNFFKKEKYYLLKQIITGTLILVIFDLVLDPGAAKLGFWEWGVNGIYYGIPISNYLGWIFSGIIGISIITLLMKKHKNNNNFLITAYLGNIFWTIITIMNLMIIPAIIGIIITIYISKKIYIKEKTNKKRK
jgi:putative membrane protein